MAAAAALLLVAATICFVAQGVAPVCEVLLQGRGAPVAQRGQKQAGAAWLGNGHGPHVYTGAQGRRWPATCMCALRPLRACARARSVPGHWRRRGTHTPRRRSSRSCARAADAVCAREADRPSSVLTHTDSIYLGLLAGRHGDHVGSRTAPGGTSARFSQHAARLGRR